MWTIQTNCLLQAFLCFALVTPSFAQTDTARSPATGRAVLFYQSYIGTDAAIYNGYAYEPNYTGVKGSPYFPDDNLTPGSILYEGISYTHLQLLYNALLDRPILSDPRSQLLCPPADKIEQFTIGEHLFVHLSAPELDAGFYEVLRSGYAGLLVRHTKQIEEKIQENILVRTITSREKYYLCKQGHYYPFDSDNGLLALLADKKQQLRQYKRAQDIRFKKDPEAALEKLIDYYNQLPH